MADNRDMLHLWNRADEDGKAIILDVLKCAAEVGEPFFDEMQIHFDNGDAAAMAACVTKWRSVIDCGERVACL